MLEFVPIDYVKKVVRIFFMGGGYSFGTYQNDLNEISGEEIKNLA